MRDQMAKKKQVHLAINLLATGRHNASWKTLPNPQTLSTDIDTFIEIAKIAERGKLDGIFLADGHAGVGEENIRRPFRSLAPSVLLATLAAHTKHIGLVVTSPALYGNPNKDTAIIRRAKLVEDAKVRNLSAKQVLLNHVTGGHRVIVGTPEQVADDLLTWIDEGACDGFNFNIDRFIDGLDHLVDWLVPELQQRGRFRKEYESTTFRGNLGVA